MEEPLHDSDWRTLKSDLASRIREVRIALYGENGGPLLAQASGFRSGPCTTTRPAAPSPLIRSCASSS